MKDFSVALIACCAMVIDFLVDLWRPDTEIAKGWGLTVTAVLFLTACWFILRRNQK